MTLRVYAYRGCDTCREALKFLAEQKVAHEVVPIREQPPTVEELRKMLGHVGGEVRRLFNTSGGDYQAMNLKETLPGLPVEAALALLSQHGNLVKRPCRVSLKSGILCAIKSGQGSEAELKDRRMEEDERAGGF